MTNRVKDAIYFGVAMVLLVLVASIQTPSELKAQKFRRGFFSRIDWGLVLLILWLFTIFHWGYLIWTA